MKNLLILMFMFIAYISRAQDDVITRFFSEYEGKENFTSVYITNKMFSLIAQIPEGEDEEEVMRVIRKLTGLKILSTDISEDAEKISRKAFDILIKNSFEELMIVKDGDEEIKFLVKQHGDIISEFVMLSGGNGQFSLISITGNLQMKDLSKLSKTMDIDGFDKLDKIDHK